MSVLLNTNHVIDELILLAEESSIRDAQSVVLENYFFFYLIYWFYRAEGYSKEAVNRFMGVIVASKIDTFSNILLNLIALFYGCHL